MGYREHKVSFERAATLFLDPNAMSIFDAAHSEEEERWVPLGIDRAGMLLVVCHTFREDKAAGGKAGAKVRLISPRRADRRGNRTVSGT
ncbi:MAG: BrnT family toxin [Bryobacteraceae bacterium]